MRVRANHFVSGMTAGLIVGSIASIIATSNMSGRARRSIKQTASRAARTIGDNISNAMND